MSNNKYPCDQLFAPQLPVTPAQVDEVAPLPGKSMCEVCGDHVAEDGDFLCMECISRMLLDME